MNLKHSKYFIFSNSVFIYYLYRQYKKSQKSNNIYKILKKVIYSKYSKYFILSNSVFMYYLFKQYKNLQKMNKIYKVLITGGAGGLGWNLAKKFLKNGSKVLIVDHNQSSLDLIQDQDGLEKYKCDITDYNKVAEMYKKINPESIDILINNAGIVNKKLLSDLSPEEIMRTFNVNTLALFWMTKSILPYFEKKNGGVKRIILT